jgi:hypothetical protein
MKRIATIGLLVCVSLMGVVSASAQETKSTHADEKESTKWKQLGPGLSVQKLWSKHEWPQVAVLKMSDDVYQKFKENPAVFINTNKIFPVAVKDPTGPTVTLKAPQQSGGVWMLILAHGKTSIVYSAAVPEPLEQ